MRAFLSKLFAWLSTASEWFPRVWAWLTTNRPTERRLIVKRTQTEEIEIRLLE